MERGPIQDGVIRRITRSLSLVTSAPMPGPPKFRFSTEDLRELHNPKNIRAFLEAGGVRGLVSGLKTDRTDGIGAVATPTDQPLRHTSSQLRTGAPSATSASDLDGSSRSSTVDVSSRASTAAAIDPGLVAERRAIFGSNTLPTRKPPHLLQLLWNAYNDRVLFLLTAAALVSLAIGLYQSFTSDHGPGNPPIEWVSGAAILIAISIIVLVSTINDWEKWRQFRMLNQKQLERDVRVIRSGYASLLPRDEVVVGDVVRLESGDVVPADGIFIDGYNIACDESNATGQSGLVHKTPGDEVYDELKRRGQPISSEPQPGLDPFMLSGTRVLEGVGSFLVTCTGNKSTYGKLLSSLKYEEDPTPLQRRLSVLAQQMVYVGGAVSILLFIALLIIFCVGLSNDTRSPTERGQAFVGIVITCLTVLVIAMPEGVPLAATLSLAYGTTRMVKEHNLVRQLKGCETMGNVTSICSDIVGTLTQNKVTVVSAMVGSNIKFHDQPIPADAAGDAASHTPAQFVSRLAADVQRDLRESIALNTTAFEGERGSSFVGAHTEVAFLTFAREHLHMGPLRLEKDSADVVQLIPFSPTRQCMAAVVKRPSSALPFRVFVKGASEFLLSKCTRIVLDPRLDAADGALTAHDRKAVLDAIGAFTGRGLQTVSLVYRDLPWFERDSESADPDPQAALDHLLQEMTFLSVFGMHDPVRLGLRESVKQCHEAGVAVRIVTGDNLLTAKIITEQCGIYSPDGDDLAMEGADFRALDDEQLRDRVPRLKVLAGCSPQDKEWLVEQLKRRKEIVAVTGYSTSDVPAMVAADVSLSIGSANGTEVARQASSIILMQGDFTSIVRCITWGRAVNSSVKKFLLFQISITITVAFIAVVSAVSNPDGNSVLTPVQLMWVNLFQDTGSLALSTDRPQPRGLRRQPEPRNAALISITMWKIVIGLSVYQIVVTYILYFVGPKIFPSQTDADLQQLSTLVFNAYVWMQIFTILNCRQFDNTLNIFEGMFSNWLFLAFTSTMIGVQVLIIFVGGEAFPATPLTGVQWATSLVLGLLVLPVGALLRCIPDRAIERAVATIVAPLRRLRRK